MKLECLDADCKKQFVYAGEKTITIETDVPRSIISSDINVEIEATTYRCCPYCGSLNFDEIKEEQVKAEIVSLKDVPHSEVDEWLGKGYKVHTIYAKNTILTLSMPKTPFNVEAEQ